MNNESPTYITIHAILHVNLEKMFPCVLVVVSVTWINGCEGIVTTVNS